MNNTLWQDSEYAWSTFHKVLKPPVLNIPGLRLWQGCEYARVTQGAEYASISLKYLNNVNMREYALITLNTIEYAGIYLKKINK